MKKSKNHKYAVMSLSLGCLSILSCFLWYISIYIATAGMIFGFLSFQESKKSEQDLPMAGMIVSSVGLFAAVFFVAFMLFIMNQAETGTAVSSMPFQ